MKIRLGYVSINTTLNISASKTITYTNFTKHNDYKIIDNIIKTNLESLLKILKYNSCNNIHFYRLSSSIIPLVTHPNIDYNYLNNYDEYYNKISRIINNKEMRIDIHASNYCILNSKNKDVVKQSIKLLEYYYNLLNKLEIPNPLIILHIGSATEGKEEGIKRFIDNFNNLPNYLKEIITIENDDKTYNIKDIIFISNKLNIPITLDYHHHLCNNVGNIEEYMPYILNSWKNITPKMHFSSPLNNKNRRSHSDYIDVDNFIDFITILSKYNKDIDIMLEAKSKDDALYKLIRELKYKTNYKFIDESTFEL